MPRAVTTSPLATDSRHAALDLAPLTDADIAAQTDEGSFKRGRGYFRSGRIFGAIRRENTLRARCHGSSGGPYLVEVTLAKASQRKPHNPVAVACDCPRGGFCKHIVALLLTWIDTPDAFEARPPIAEILSGKSSEELIALIVTMLGANPDLEAFLELPIPIAGTQTDDAVDEAAIRRQVAVAMQEDDGYERYDRYGRHGRYDYEEFFPGSRIAGKLERLAALAEGHVATGNWRSALLISATLIEELVPRLDSVDDHDGDLFGIIGRADQALSACLLSQEAISAEQRLTADERSRLIDTLMTIWQTDFAIGGVGISDEGPEAIARAASPEEQRRVADLVREAMKPAAGSDWNRSWRNQEAIGFLSLLGGEAGLSDEELLSEFRNAELWDEAAKMLVQLDRVDEAIVLASRRLIAATPLTAFADRLIATGDPKRIEQAITLVDDRLWEQEGTNHRDDEILRQWLERRYAEHGRPEKALELARGRFKTAPSKAAYDAVRSAALLPGQPDDPWPALRPTLIDDLRKRAGWYALIDIHLEEGEVAEALKALKKTEKGNRNGQVPWSYGWTVPAGGYDARVAAAAESDFPDEAIQIYQRLANTLIAARGRANYQIAAGYLVRVMRLLEAHGRAEEWSRLISELRAANKTLRALKEELDSLGL